MVLMPDSSAILALHKIYFILLFLMPMKVDIDGNYIFLYFRFNGAKARPVFYILYY